MFWDFLAFFIAHQTFSLKIGGPDNGSSNLRGSNHFYTGRRIAPLYIVTNVF